MTSDSRKRSTLENVKCDKVILACILQVLKRRGGGGGESLNNVLDWLTKATSLMLWAVVHLAIEKMA